VVGRRKWQLVDEGLRIKPDLMAKCEGRKDANTRQVVVTESAKVDASARMESSAGSNQENNDKVLGVQSKGNMGSAYAEENSGERGYRGEKEGKEGLISSCVRS